MPCWRSSGLAASWAARCCGPELARVIGAGPLGIRIVRARERSLAEINGLIARAKSHWAWPKEYLERALPLHRLTPAYLQSNHCFEVLSIEDELIGFCAVAAGEPKILFDNLWIAPDRIRQGIGRHACEHVFRLGREQGWKELWVLPDPPAEGFYRKMGFVDTGDRVSSRVPGGPVFPVYCIRLQA